MPVDEAGRLHATGYSRASSLLTERGNYEAAVPLCLCASVPLCLCASVGACLLANPGQQAATAAL